MAQRLILASVHFLIGGACVHYHIMTWSYIYQAEYPPSHIMILPFTN